MTSLKAREFTPREKIAKARINLLTDFPFYGSICMKLVPRELSEEEVKAFDIRTMAVDIYGNLMYNPKWIEQQTDDVMQAAVCHETLHLCLKHLERIGTRDQKLWNLATDSAINDILKGSFRVPNSWVHFKEMSRKSAEEIYDWLIKNIQIIRIPVGCGFDKHIYSDKSREGCRGERCRGEHRGKGGATTGATASPFYQEGQTPFDPTRAIREAYNFAKSQGRVPAGIERVFADILAPQMNWKDILRKYLVQMIPHDYSYVRPSKKSYACGYYLPMITKEEIELVIGVDSSGSISDTEYAEFLSEIVGMCRQFEALRATVIVCDAAVQCVQEIDNNFDPNSIKGRGYGGTLSQPVYDWIVENIGEQNVKLLIYFTDGYIDLPNKVYAFHTLWVVTKNGRTDEVEKMKNATVIQMLKNGEENCREE